MGLDWPKLFLAERPTENGFFIWMPYLISFSCNATVFNEPQHQCAHLKCTLIAKCTLAHLKFYSCTPEISLETALLCSWELNCIDVVVKSQKIMAKICFVLSQSEGCGAKFSSRGEPLDPLHSFGSFILHTYRLIFGPSNQKFVSRSLSISIHD